MVKRAQIENARALADLAIQMWTEHDPEDLEEEFRELAINYEAACFIKYAAQRQHRTARRNDAGAQLFFIDSPVCGRSADASRYVILTRLIRLDREYIE